MEKAVLLFVVLLTASSLVAQPHNCPSEGDAATSAQKDLNRKKNRSITVSSLKEPEQLELKKLLPSKPRKNDKTLWKEGAYVVTEGYLVHFEEEGPESCNCGKASAKQKTGDVHMFLGLVPNALTKNCLVIEITPKFKIRFPDYEVAFLHKQAKLRVQGYLFYDYPHQKQAFTTCDKCTRVWRKTPWEIHPITSIEVIEQGG